MSINRHRQIQLSPTSMPHFFAYSEDRSREPRPAQLLPCRGDELFRQGRGLYMTSHGKAQKVVNIRRNPKVALMIGPTTPMPRCAGHGARVARSSREPMLFERHFAREAEARGLAPARPSRIERSRRYRADRKQRKLVALPEKAATDTDRGVRVRSVHDEVSATTSRDDWPARRNGDSCLRSAETRRRSWVPGFKVAL
jgi:hypothetical protein